MGISFDKILVILFIAAFLVGPEKLPKYAASLAHLVRKLRSYLDSTKSRLKDEMGEDVDWKSLDPRQYDPRRIIREALAEPAVPTPRPSASSHSEHGASDGVSSPVSSVDSSILGVVGDRGESGGEGSGRGEEPSGSAVAQNEDQEGEGRKTASAVAPSFDDEAT